ncbi:MAG: hypothetical protein WCP28_22410 [Actinomycetes bacterium]
MAARALEVEECRSPAGSTLPQPTDSLHPLTLLPPRWHRGERQHVVAVNEFALYSNLHIALQQLLNLLERGHPAVSACSVLVARTEDQVTQDSFSQVRDYMSGSAPGSFYSGLDRAWPAKENYGSHPAWWADYLPKRRNYRLPTNLARAFRGADPGDAGVTSALQTYYAPAVAGNNAAMRQRLAAANRSLLLAAEMVRLANPAVRERAEAICAKTGQLLNQTAARAFSNEFDVGVRIAVDYLPHTLKSYLDVPSDDAPIQICDGRSARDLAVEQLDMISAALDAAITNHAEAEASELLANQRFLESRFARSPLDIPRQSAGD